MVKPHSVVFAGSMHCTLLFVENWLLHVMWNFDIQVFLRKHEAAIFYASIKICK